MSDNRPVARRDFLHASAALAFSGCGFADRVKGPEAVEEAAARVGRLPRRKLGGGREISVIVGASSWSRPAVEAGIRCGINFWHKTEDWEGNVPQDILKNRDAHYCQVCVDRSRGNHEVGVQDEEAHYQHVKSALARTGLRYFDDMQFHFGYHSIAELKGNRAFVRAYQRLKKEGLVKHLCLSQHSYTGNSRVPGGEGAPEILKAVAADGVFEHAQFIYSYGEHAAWNDFLAFARQRGFGTIAMKTSRGAGRMAGDPEFMKQFPAGTTPYHALARWLTTRAPIDAAVIQITSLSQFTETLSGAGKEPRAADAEAIRKMVAYADRQACRLCGECQGACEQGVPIADILRYERYARDYHDPVRARRLYSRLDVRADACVGCRSCTTRCPQPLNIPEKLAEAHQILA
jgi:predicted aldo/keto reductase-like oxidoreductase